MKTPKILNRFLLLLLAPIAGVIMGWDKEWYDGLLWFRRRLLWGAQVSFRVWKTLTWRAFYPGAGYYAKLRTPPELAETCLSNLSSHGPRQWFKRDPGPGYTSAIL